LGALHVLADDSAEHGCSCSLDKVWCSIPRGSRPQEKTTSGNSGGHWRDGPEQVSPEWACHGRRRPWLSVPAAPARLVRGRMPVDSGGVTTALDGHIELDDSSVARIAGTRLKAIHLVM